MDMWNMNMGGGAASNSTWCAGSSPMNNGFTPGATAGTCVVFLFPQWVLDTQSKYTFAVFFAFFMAVLLPLIAWPRMRAMRIKSAPRRIAVTFFVTAFQVTLMYWLMLIVMTYSTFLFLAVVFGLTIGQMITGQVFWQPIPEPKASESERLLLGKARDDDVESGSTPASDGMMMQNCDC